jgi:hypothetical protein
VLSRPELVDNPDQSNSSPMEKAFNEGLTGSPKAQSVVNLKSPSKKLPVRQISTISQPAGYIEELELSAGGHSRD